MLSSCHSADTDHRDDAVTVIRINLAMYRRAGVLWNEEDADGNPWALSFLRMFDMANDSGRFGTRVEMETADFDRVGDQYERAGKITTR